LAIDASDQGTSKVLAALRVQHSSTLRQIHDPESLLRACENTLGMYLHEPGVERYLDWQHESGAALDRAMAEGLGAQWVRWGIGTPELGEARRLDDRELFGMLHTAARANRLAIRRVWPESARLGRGDLVAELGTADWPYPGMRTQQSLFVPAGGRLQEDEVSSLDEQGRTAFLRITLEWSDGSIGLLRLNFAHVGGRWTPITAAIASDSEDHWPWPIL
jgi:hypothetical protein